MTIVTKELLNGLMKKYSDLPNLKNILKKYITNKKDDNLTIEELEAHLRTFFEYSYDSDSDIELPKEPVIIYKKPPCSEARKAQLAKARAAREQKIIDRYLASQQPAKHRKLKDDSK